MTSVLHQRKNNSMNIAAQICSIMTPDLTPLMTKEPIYEDVELTDKISTIDL